MRIEPPFLRQHPRRSAGGERPCLGLARQTRDLRWRVGRGGGSLGTGLGFGDRVRDQFGDERLGLVDEAGDQGVEGEVGLHLRGVDEELSAPDQAGLLALAQVDDPLEEALENNDPKPSPDPRQARRVVGERLVEGVAEVPAMSEVEAGRLDEFPLRPNALEERDGLEFDEHHRVDARSSFAPRGR